MAQGGNVWIWDVKTGHPLLSLKPQGRTGSLGNADAVAFNRAGTEVAVGYQGGYVIIFGIGGNQVQRINVGSLIQNVQFVGKTGELAIATDKKAVLWLPRDGSQAGPVVSAGPATSIAVDPTNDLEFAVTTASGTRIWTLSGSLHPLRPGGLSLPGPSAASGDTEDSDAGFSGDGTEVVTANSDDGALRVYNAATGKQIATLNPGHGVPESVAFSPHGKLIAAGYSSGATIVWDAVTETEQTQLTGNTGSVSAVGFSGDGSEIVTASDDGSVRIWDARPRELQAAFGTSFSSGAPNPAYAAQYSPGGRQILAVDSSGNAYLVTPSGAQVATLNPGSQVYVNSAQYNPNGTQIVTANADGSVDLWDASGQQLTLPSAIQLPVSASYAAFSPDSSSIVVLAGDGTVQVFSTVTGQRLHSITTSSLFISSMAAFSPDGRQILTADPDGQVEVWDAATGHYLKAMGKQGKGINDLQFDNTGSEFVTTSYDGVVTVWSAHDRRLHSFTGSPHPAAHPSAPEGMRWRLAAATVPYGSIRRPGSR